VEEQQPRQHRGGSTTSSTWTSLEIIKSHFAPLDNKTINRDNSNNINKKKTTGTTYFSSEKDRNDIPVGHSSRRNAT